jgi:hypothetical protein
MVAEYLNNPNEEQIQAEVGLLISLAYKGLSEPSIYNSKGVQNILSRNDISVNGAFETSNVGDNYLPISLAGAVLNSVHDFISNAMGPYNKLRDAVTSSAIQKTQELEAKIIRNYASINIEKLNSQNNGNSLTAANCEQELSDFICGIASFLPVHSDYLQNHNQQMLNYANHSVKSTLTHVRSTVASYEVLREKIGRVIVPAKNDLDSLVLTIKSCHQLVGKLPSLYVSFSKALTYGDQLFSIGSEVAAIKIAINQIAIDNLERVSKELQASTVQGISRYHNSSISLDDLSEQILNRTSNLETTYASLINLVSDDNTKLEMNNILDSTRTLNNQILNSYITSNINPALENYEDTFLKLALSHINSNTEDQERYTTSLHQISSNIEERILPFASLFLEHALISEYVQTFNNIKEGATSKIQKGMRAAINHQRNLPKESSTQDEDLTTIVPQRAVKQVQIH